MKEGKNVSSISGSGVSSFGGARASDMVIGLAFFKSSGSGGISFTSYSFLSIWMIFSFSGLVMIVMVGPPFLEVNFRKTLLCHVFSAT